MSHQTLLCNARLGACMRVTLWPETCLDTAKRACSMQNPSLHGERDRWLGTTCTSPGDKRGAVEIIWEHTKTIERDNITHTFYEQHPARTQQESFTTMS